ncbi:MAG: hypothetical protein AB4050_13895 [Synechococcus sp.]
MSYRPRQLRRHDRLPPSRRRRTLALRVALGVLIVLSIPIALECFARLLAGVSGVSEDFTQIDEPGIVTAYRLDTRTPQGLTVTPDRRPGQLMATYHPQLGYRLMPDRRTDYWSINSSGFRDDDEIAVETPDGEIRIALLGGSAAFGQFSSTNSSTIAEQLETLLNQRVARQQEAPDEFQPERLPFFADRVSEVLALPPRIRTGNYRVINAAVPGYASSNELVGYLQHVAAYEPDIVVVLNGYADVMLPSDRWGAEGVDIERLAVASQRGMGRLAWLELKEWFRTLTLVRGFGYYVLSSEPEPEWRSFLGVNQFAFYPETARETNSQVDASEDGISIVRVPKDDAEQRQRLDRYQQSLEQLVQLTSGMNRELLIVVQPELTGRDPQVLSSTERAIALGLGNTYRTVMPDLFEHLEAVAQEVAQGSDRATAIGLYGEMSEMDGAAFYSPDSLTDEGNAVVADRLFEEVTQMLVVFPRLFDPNRDRRQ